ncbi:hypothetical protein [Dactylosporangium sp. CA-233914]|uniref:hypothetical protein n=1 Tax=Dactylosporangium sp. CA-233914 TaxID=3239934 RepID=UPI003D92815F
MELGQATGDPRTVTVSGDGFAPNSPVTIAIYSAPHALGTGTADAAGHAELQVVIPAGYTGNHTLALAGFASDGSARFLTVALKVTAAGLTLPVTGPSAVPLTAYGVALILLGALLAAAPRYIRRRPARHCQ